MYSHILIGISVLTFCFGDSSNQAISSISFHRDDVPLSYKYSSIHIYSTEKPNSQTRPDLYRNIQYAPLPPNYNDKKVYNGLHTEAIVSKWDKIQNVTKNEYLEPQVHSSGNNYGIRQFVAGYNIDAPKLNNLGYNNRNSEYKNIALHNNNKQSINKLILHTNAESIPSKNYESSHFNNLIVLNARKHQENIPKVIQVLSVMENAQIHPVLNPYLKVPQMHLNVARAYKFVPTADKAPINGYQNLLRSNHEQLHVKQIDIPSLREKTVLYPQNINRQQHLK